MTQLAEPFDMRGRSGSAGSISSTGTSRTSSHSDEESRRKHDAMGFRDGWGKALEQLIEHMKTVRL